MSANRDDKAKNNTAYISAAKKAAEVRAQAIAEAQQLAIVAAIMQRGSIPCPTAPDHLTPGSKVTIILNDAAHPGEVITTPDSEGYIQVRAAIIASTMPPWRSMGYHIHTGTARYGISQLAL